MKILDRNYKTGCSVYSGAQGGEMGRSANCEYCVNYSYDEDYECYTCEVNLDEDEMAKFITGDFRQCPYFKMGDEYRIVRKQM